MSLVILPLFDSIKLSFFVCSTTSQISEFNTTTFQLILKLLENNNYDGLGRHFRGGAHSEFNGTDVEPPRHAVRGILFLKTKLMEFHRTLTQLDRGVRKNIETRVRCTIRSDPANYIFRPHPIVPVNQMCNCRQSWPANGPVSRAVGMHWTAPGKPGLPTPDDHMRARGARNPNNGTRDLTAIPPITGYPDDQNEASFELLKPLSTQWLTPTDSGLTADARIIQQPMMIVSLAPSVQCRIQRLLESLVSNQLSGW